jgi:glycosyltransferase involved in cell wall biosynthesis
VTRRIRILMPTIYYPPRVGGIESHVYYLARELARREHRVTVVTTKTEPDSPLSEIMDGVRVERLPSFGKHFAGWILSSLYSVPKVVSEAARHDIVHCHTFAFAAGGTVAAAVLRRPLVVTVHSSHFLRLAENPGMRPALKLVLCKASALLSTSKEIDSVVKGLLPDAYTLPIVNGIDTEKFKPSRPSIEKGRDEFLIVCPRRLVEKNGVEYLIRALAILKKTMKVKVHITGDGPLREHLEGLASELGVRAHVVFMGSIDNSRMPSVYSSADLVVVPSLVEATSIAALEAMSCERVVAASRVGGLPEIIDDRVGVLFDSGSPEAIAAAVLDVAGRSDTADLGREARKRVDANWSIRKVADIHEEVYARYVEDARDA